MRPFPRTPQDALLARLARIKSQPTTAPKRLGDAAVEYFNSSVRRRLDGLSRISTQWESIIPQSVNQHCILESFSSGTLRVSVDSSAHLYLLKQLLLAGVQQQIIEACRGSGLRRIVLRAGGTGLKGRSDRSGGS
jgi:hypothetical protein